MKAKHCDECKHATVKWYVHRGSPAFPDLTCAKKHKPRFYEQRNDNPLDDSYGWKRVCADFETHNAELRGASQLAGAASRSNAELGEED